MIFSGLSIGTWCAIGAAAAVAVSVWCLGRKTGRKARLDFYGAVFFDLREILCGKAGIAPAAAGSVVNALKLHQTNATPPPSLLRVEYTLERQNATTVNRILAVAYLNAEGQPMLSKIEREYDWDFIPDELASETIRAGKQNLTILLYTKP